MSAGMMSFDISINTDDATIAHADWVCGADQWRMYRALFKPGSVFDYFGMTWKVTRLNEFHSPGEAVRFSLMLVNVPGEQAA